MFKEFKNFIMTGNVIDLAVAVLLAGAVGMVVNGFVNDIMMPIVGYFTGGVDFSDMKIILSEAVMAEDGSVATPESAIRYGAWINSIINLVIVGFVLFMIVKSYNKVRKKEEPKPEAPKGPTQEELLAEIRDLLKKN
ncbi:large-conductance mechanosensitive channel protein MscL [Robiginitalea sp. SC105]|uniref:large-conductance mechanosensitive channel protein MscL n=1 Tax=Robiginitalea sp. SC105 TaxID=2762332 RepID=UPI00163B60EA|nr:large-conductance mechanosensitive channel protein MscL [Robiginitalea sp. SC105]MBC2838091.1 large-conductance mechanosensitive channel protein MscL [Robiginitalea sp. SC105]